MSKLFSKKGNRVFALILACVLVVSALAIGLGSTLAAKPDITVDLSVQPNPYPSVAVGATNSQLGGGIAYATSHNTEIVTTPSGKLSGAVTFTGVKAGLGVIGLGSTMGFAGTLPIQVYDNTKISAYTLKNGAEVVLSKAGNTAAASTYVTTTPPGAVSTITWKSMQTDIAAVNETSGLITAVGKGSAIVTGTFSDKWGREQAFAVLVAVGKPGNVIGPDDDGKYWVSGDTDNIFYETDEDGNLQFPPHIVYDPDGAANGQRGTDVYKGDSGNYYIEKDGFPNIWTEINPETGVPGENAIWGGTDNLPGGGDDKPAKANPAKSQYYIGLGQNVFQPVERTGARAGLGKQENGNDIYVGGGLDCIPGTSDDLTPVFLHTDGKFYAGPFGPSTNRHFVGDMPLGDGGDGALNTAGNGSGGYNALHYSDKIWYMDSNGNMVDTPPPAPPSVDSVTVAPATASVAKGASQQFTATVTGTNNPSQSVQWTVDSENGSTINANGELTIAAGETKSTLTVKATSALDPTKSGTAVVTVTGGGTGGGTGSGPLKTSTVDMISTSDSTYIIKDDGTLWSTGSNGSGRLGLGGTVNRRLFEQVRPDLRFSMISQYGLGNVLALTTSGKVYAWGRNSYGALGDGTDTDRSIPILVPYFEINNIKIKQVAAGGHYFSAALSEAGEVYTWGYNGYGCLGRGNDTIHQTNWTPERIQVGPTGTKIKMISCGYNFMFALSEAGDLYSWGYNGYGQLGLGHRVTNELTRSPSRVMMQVPTVFTDVECQSYAHVLALDDQGRLYAWGYNGYGQLGNSGRDWVSSPEFVLASLELRFKAIATGWRMSMALTRDGDIYTFGQNNYGVLGHGNTSDSPLPRKINSNVKYRAIEAGDITAMAISEEGRLYMWGDNGYAQYGDGTTTRSYLPKLISLY